MRVPRTFAFVDLSGFTNYTAAFGDDAAGRLLGAFRTITREVASERGVRIAKWLGDGCMIVSVDQAACIAFALELEHRSAEVCAPLALRVGIATGHALLFEGDDYIGSAVNMAVPPVRRGRTVRSAAADHADRTPARRRRHRCPRRPRAAWLPRPDQRGRAQRRAEAGAPATTPASCGRAAHSWPDTRRASARSPGDRPRRGHRIARQPPRRRSRVRGRARAATGAARRAVGRRTAACRHASTATSSSRCTPQPSTARGLGLQPWLRLLQPASPTGSTTRVASPTIAPPATGGRAGWNWWPNDSATSPPAGCRSRPRIAHGAAADARRPASPRRADAHAGGRVARRVARSCASARRWPPRSTSPPNDPPTERRTLAQEAHRRDQLRWGLWLGACATASCAFPAAPTSQLADLAGRLRRRRAGDARRRRGRAAPRRRARPRAAARRSPIRPLGDTDARACPGGHVDVARGSASGAAR